MRLGDGGARVSSAFVDLLVSMGNSTRDFFARAREPDLGDFG